ncbi:MAG: hypothetical protein CVU03_02035 [Bacteroidetes bacterium HGW-Bacteroidetes-2]|jgi:broad-specificity NMP kinase|nr:MAG: hypothetical protein CVU13_06280 [Bacteroidetes bacterium HGW-Bacteroidetes-8]PKP26676.1 MAG: hypothetical protein CVU03_02035 [Bacteroidetes bacterium HGW-Bacteroidetes-2]
MKDTWERRRPFNNNSQVYDVFSGAKNYHNNRFYFASFGKYPSILTVNDVKSRNLKKQLEIEFAGTILERVELKEYDKKRKELFSEVFYFLEGNLMVNLEYDKLNIHHTGKETALVCSLRDLAFQHLQKKKKKSSIHLMIATPHGIDTEQVKYKKPKLNLEKHYNDGFTEVHNSILQKLCQKNSNGLFLLHGKPGTGKSTYIRHLICQMKKKVIFLSPNMAGQLDHMELTRFLINNKNTVFVIEDAEQLIASRENERNSSLSTLLNLTDGILGECLSIQVIATFNTHVKNIDEALLRKGRLQLMYEFENLTVEKSNVLLQELNVEHRTTVPITLAELYNYEAVNRVERGERKVIGFR